MKQVKIAFDIDGTLRNNKKRYGVRDANGIVINERIRTLLITLSTFKNVDIIVWSGGGALYAAQVCGALGLGNYVDRYAGKDEADDIKPDIAIDDMHACELGIINLIVREK